MWQKRSFGALAAAGVLALGAYAWAASAASKPKAGRGTGVISGYQVSRVTYATRGDLLTGVSFELDAPATRVGIRLDSAGGTWFECAASAATPPFSVSCTVRVPISDADTLTVSAQQ